MNSTDDFMFVLSASFCANVDALVAFVSQAAICKLTRFRMRVSQDFDSPDLMVHLIIFHRDQSR